MNRKNLIIFEKNTDAISTNRGFLYQYLMTLVEWLTNYIKNINDVIYCETDEDIKEISEIDGIINYKQLKCYSSSFSLDSKEIKKSLYNFFMLFMNASEDYKRRFSFITNTSIKKSDTILNNWADRSKPVNTDEIDFIEPVQKILISIFESEYNRKIDSINKKIVKRNNKISNGDKNPKFKKDIDDFKAEINKVTNVM